MKATGGNVAVVNTKLILKVLIEEEQWDVVAMGIVEVIILWNLTKTIIYIFWLFKQNSEITHWFLKTYIKYKFTGWPQNIYEKFSDASIFHSRGIIFLLVWPSDGKILNTNLFFSYILKPTYCCCICLYYM